MKTIKTLFQELFGHSSPPIVTENSSLKELERNYPNLENFVERKYGLKLDAGEKSLSLKDFCAKHQLPPAQILFMEIQMSSRSKHVRQVSARDAFDFIQKNPQTKVVDVRDEWEAEIGIIQSSVLLTPQILDEILTEWKKETPILVYCHHGVRSLDFATFLTDRGFKEVLALEGGIDAWSRAVDPTIPLYDGNYC